MRPAARRARQLERTEVRSTVLTFVWSVTLTPCASKVSEIRPLKLKLGVHVGNHIHIGPVKPPKCQIWPDIGEIESIVISHNLEVKITLFGDVDGASR